MSDQVRSHTSRVFLMRSVAIAPPRRTESAASSGSRRNPLIRRAATVTKVEACEVSSLQRKARKRPSILITLVLIKKRVNRAHRKLWKTEEMPAWIDVLSRKKRS
jgi:hypothetical protein